MLSNYQEKVKLLIEWYEKAKEVSIIAESMDNSSTGYIQPLHEQRYCLDHFVRAINYESNNESAETIGKALDAAIGHLQRGYSDSVEWILVSVKEEYIKSLESYTSEQINQGFPRYYSDIRIDIDNITEQVNNYKMSKSIERASNTNIISESELKNLHKISNQFLSENIAGKLEEYRKELRNHISVLADIKKRNTKSNLFNKIALPIITGIVGAVIGGIILAVVLK